MAPRAGASCRGALGVELDWRHLGDTAHPGPPLHRGTRCLLRGGVRAGREMLLVKPAGGPLSQECPSLDSPLPPRSRGFEGALLLATEAVLTNRSRLVRKPSTLTPSVESLIQTKTGSQVGTSTCRQPARGREGEAQAAGDLGGPGEAEDSLPIHSSSFLVPDPQVPLEA